MSEAPTSPSVEAPPTITAQGEPVLPKYNAVQTAYYEVHGYPTTPLNPKEPTRDADGKPISGYHP